MKPTLALRRFLAVSSLLVMPFAHAADGTWNQTDAGPFDWGAAGNWDGTIADGAGSTAFFTPNLIADQTVNLETARTIGNITFTDSTTSSNNLTLSGANLLTLAGTAPTISVTQADRTLSISSGIAGSDGLRKIGLGALTLNGTSANTFTGGVDVSGGTLALDYANLGASNNLVDSGNALTLASGGVFTLNGNAANNSVQSFASTTFGFGINTLSLAKGASATSVTLNLGVLTVSPGSVTTILPGTPSPPAYSWPNSVTPTSEIMTVTGITGKTLPSSPGTENWINVNAGLFYRQNTNAGSARWVSVDNLGQLQGLPAALALQGTSGTVTVARQISTANITLGGDAESYGLVVNSNNAARQLNLGGFDYTINGILGVNTNLATIVPGDGGRIVIGSERNLVINMDNSAGVTINAPIENNGAGNSSVTVMGTRPNGAPGTVILAGNNTFSGGLISSGTGQLRLDHGNAAGTGTITLASTQTSTPATFTIGNDINLANPIQIQAEVGRNSISSTAGSNTLSGGITINNNSGNIIVLNNGGASGSNFTVGGATPNSTTITAASFGSQISFRAATNGALGVLNSQINAPNADFNGNNNGNWTINSTGNTWRITSLTGASRFVLGATDALATGAPVLISSTGFLDLNGFNQTVAGLGGTNAAGRVINNSNTADSTLTLAGLTADRNLPGFIADGSNGRKTSLVMNSSGRTQTLSGPNTHTGGTTVSAGTLTINGALADATMTINGGSVNGSGVLTFKIDGSSFDQVVMSAGTLDVTGMTLRIPAGANLTEPEYLVVNASGGTLTGPFAALDDATLSGYTLDYGTANQVKLVPGSGNNFQAWANANNVTGGPGGDSNNNGVPNLVEYALADNAVRGSLSGNTLTFTKRGAPYGGDITYIIEISTSLEPGSWTPAVTHGPAQLGSPLTYTFTPSPGAPKEFARLKVTIP